MRRFPAQEAADGDDGVDDLRLGDFAGCGGNLPRTGYAEDVDFVLFRAAAVEAVERALEETICNHGVPAGDDDCERHSFGGEIAGDGNGLATERVEPLPEGESDAGNGL